MRQEFGLCYTPGMVIEPIGIIHSCFRDRFGTPRQPGLVPSSLATIELAKKVQPEFSLQGLGEFSHLWVIFHFHQNTNKKFNAKVHPPRLEGESVGVFATRSPHRPNPIGLSLVEIVEVRKDDIIVQGHDFVDGTPVLDLKPYLPSIESKPEARSSWVSKKPEKASVQIHWTAAAAEKMQNLETETTDGRLRRLIEETLALDPRPTVYKGFEGLSSEYRETHAVRLKNIDVHFKFRTPLELEIIEIRDQSDHSNR